MINLRINGGLSVNQQLRALRLNAGKRRTINRALARKVASFSRARIRQQRGLDGRAWEGRKKGRGKMLRGLSKRMQIQANADTGKIRFAGGKVAYKQQHGYKETFDANKAAQRGGSSGDTDNKPATRSQARRLKTLGYRRRRGKRYTKPTQAWIMHNMSMSQAGAIIRAMAGGTSRDEWTVELPARSFLGVTSEDDATLLDLLVQKLNN